MSDYTVIDSDDYKASGIEAFFFPGGEPHVKIPELGERTLLHLKLRTWNDVGLAVCLMDAIYRQQRHHPEWPGPHASWVPEVRAFIPYFPGSRQDRTDGFTPITKEIVSCLLCFGDIPVYVFDPHSDTGRYGYGHQELMPVDLDLSHLKAKKYTGVIAPDFGAKERALQMWDALGAADYHVAEKQREFGTGRITGYDIGELRPDGRYLVVDDICDGGATFNLLAAAVPEGTHLDLWVSHGIFSKGVRALSGRYHTIYTTDSWHRPGGIPTDRVITTTKLSTLFDKIMES